MASIRESSAFLRRHGWESVQIFCTRKHSSSGKWVNVNWGEGNWFTRYGHIRAWMNQEEARPSQLHDGDGESEE